eukprot:4620285-Pyramimonas_sp.AAC.1
MEDASDRAAALTKHWGSVFARKPWPSQTAAVCVNRFVKPASFEDCPPPSLAVLRKVALRVSDSAPGVGRLCYAAWLAHPSGLLVLHDALLC